MCVFSFQTQSLDWSNLRSWTGIGSSLVVQAYMYACSAVILDKQSATAASLANGANVSMVNGKADSEMFDQVIQI